MVRDSRIRENPLTLGISHPTPIRPEGTIKQQQHPSTRSVYIPRPFGRVRTKNQGQEQIQNNPRPPIHLTHPSTRLHLTTIRRQHSTTPPPTPTLKPRRHHHSASPPRTPTVTTSTAPQPPHHNHLNTTPKIKTEK
ncbi:hypothetical protein QL285_078180 [Trifolium repens]|nr:hypothetical protein QL285_078180 [Trifolium repens]